VSGNAAQVHEGRVGPLPLGAYGEPDGTIAWLGLLAELRPAPDRGAVLLVDDLDAVLDRGLAAEALRLLRDRDLNRARAQLVFTARSAPPALDGTEGAEVLDPGQAWYAVKGTGGATTLRGAPTSHVLGPGELARELWLAKQRLAP